MYRYRYGQMAYHVDLLQPRLKRCLRGRDTATLINCTSREEIENECRQPHGGVRLRIRRLDEPTPLNRVPYCTTSLFKPAHVCNYTPASGVQHDRRVTRSDVSYVTRFEAARRNLLLCLVRQYLFSVTDRLCVIRVLCVCVCGPGRPRCIPATIFIGRTHTAHKPATQTLMARGSAGAESADRTSRH